MDNLLEILEKNSDEEVQETLGEIKKHLLQCAQESKHVLASKKFFNKANSDLAYDILEMCMTNLKISDEPDLYDIVEKILKHPNEKVKTVAIRFIEKNLAKSPALHNIATVLLMIECLQSSETSVGVPSIQILIDLLSMPTFLDDAAVKRHLLTALEKGNETVGLRVYSVAVGVARKSAVNLDKVDFLLQKGLSQIENQDVLLLMNLLEVLKDICLETFGFVYLENKGVFAKLMKRIETINEDPLAAILVPGLMKFFGNVAVVYPDKIFNAYPALIDTLFNSLFSDDFQLLYTGLDTLGYLAKFDNGKRALDSLYSDQCSKVLSHISSAILNYPSELKVRALNCFENVFWIDTSVPSNNQISYICQKWFTCVFGSELSLLLNFCHNPFDDIAMSSFRCLRSLIQHDFGKKAVESTGGLIEFLLDRNNKTSIEVMQIKYDVIKVLAESNAFNAAITLQLQKYVREGFHYVQAVTEVAFEST